MPPILCWAEGNRSIHFWSTAGTDFFGLIQTLRTGGCSWPTSYLDISKASHNYFCTCAVSSCSIADTTTNDSVASSLQINKSYLPQWNQGAGCHTVKFSLIMMTNGRGNRPVHPNKDQPLSFSSFHSNVIVQHEQSSGEDGETIRFNYLHHFKWLTGVRGEPQEANPLSKEEK